MTFGSKLLCLFLMLAIYLLVKCLEGRSLTYATDIHREAEVALNIHVSPLRDPLWPFSIFVWVSTSALRTTGLDQLINRYA